jgi:hypothetical protein
VLRTVPTASEWRTSDTVTDGDSESVTHWQPESAASSVPSGAMQSATVTEAAGDSESRHRRTQSRIVTVAAGAARAARRRSWPADRAGP